MTDIEVASTQSVQKADFRTSELERMRDKLARFMPRAVDILTELAETAENERVRLAAAESILDRSGLGKSSSTQVTVSQAEHDIATREAEEIVAKLGRQKEIESGAPVVKPSIEALVVLEGDDDTLPTTTATPEGTIEVSGSED